MKNIFLLIILGLFSVNSNSQLQKAKKFAKTITAEDLKDHLYVMPQMNLKGEILVLKDKKKLLSI